MTRRYAPRVIAASHFRTELAEEQREREHPVPPTPKPEPPAAWEAKPDPEPAKIPRHGRPPKGLVVRSAVPDDMMLLSTEEVDLLLGMADETFAREVGRDKPDPLPRVRRDPKLTTRRRTK